MRCLSEFPTRAVAIVLRERVQALWDVIAPIQAISSAWCLNQEDYLLPSPGLVKSVYDHYQGITIPKITIDDYLKTLSQCVRDVLAFDGFWSFTLQDSPRF